MEQQEVHQIVSASQRKLALEPDSPQDVYWMLKNLREQLNNLHPVQIKMIHIYMGSDSTKAPHPLTSRIKRGTALPSGAEHRV